MNITFSLDQLSRAGNLDAKLVLRQHALDSKDRFMENKCINPKMKQNYIGKELGYSCFTLQRYRHDTKMQSPFISEKPKRSQKPY